jgi:hypothetical protein
MRRVDGLSASHGRRQDTDHSFYEYPDGSSQYDTDDTGASSIFKGEDILYLSAA